MEQLEANWIAFRNGVVAALRESGSLMRRLTKDAAARIGQNQDPALGQIGPVLMQQSLYLLNKHQEEWVRIYPTYLLQAFSEVVDFDPFQEDEEITSSLGALASDASLTIQAKSEILHLRHTLDTAVGHSLAQLDGLVSAARGYSYIHQNRNPLRPENYLSAAQKMIYSSQGEDEAKLLVLKSFVVTLPPLLVRTYMLVANQMSEAGIEAVQKRNTSFGALTTGFGNMSYLNSSLQASSEDLLTKQELLKSLGQEASRYMVDLPTPAPAPAAPQAPQASPQPARADTQHADALNLPGADHALTQISPVATGAAAAAKRPSEPGSLDLQTLVITLVKDTNHLLSLKKIVAQWMPALRALVQSDPAFLRDAQHPARLFLSDIRARAKTFKTESDPGCAEFLQRVQHISNAAHLARARSAEAFQWAHGQLQRTGQAAPSQATPAAAPAPTQATRASDAKPATAPEASKPAAPVRDLDADEVLRQVAAAVQSIPSYTNSPARIQAFLKGPWAKVTTKSMLRHARDSGENFADIQALVQRDPKGYLQLVPLLLASVQAENFRTPNPDLLRSIKAMHEQLRLGLLSVGLSDKEVEPAVHKLKELHQQAMQEGSALAPQGMGTQPHHAAVGQPIDLGRAPTGTPTAPRPAAAEPVRAARPTAQADGDTLPPMPLGSWFRLGAAGLRTQLTDSDGNVFIFTSPDGQRQTMTRRRLVQLQEHGQLRTE